MLFQISSTLHLKELSLLHVALLEWSILFPSIWWMTVILSLLPRIDTVFPNARYFVAVSLHETLIQRENGQHIFIFGTRYLLPMEKSIPQWIEYCTYKALHGSKNSKLKVMESWPYINTAAQSSSIIQWHAKYWRWWLQLGLICSLRNVRSLQKRRPIRLLGIIFD